MSEGMEDLARRLVIGRKRDGRSIYDEQAKQELILACCQPGVSIAKLARECGVWSAGSVRIFVCEAVRLFHGGGRRLRRTGRRGGKVGLFSLTPAFTLAQLAEAGVAAALYPVSAARAMAAAASRVYEAILREGSVQPMLDQMQTRQELYEVLNYRIRPVNPS